MISKDGYQWVGTDGITEFDLDEELNKRKLSRFIYTCNGINDNEIITQMAADFINDGLDNNLLYIQGTGVFGVSQPVEGNGESIPHIFLKAYVPEGSNKRIFLDFTAVDFSKASYDSGGAVSVFCNIRNCTFRGNVIFKTSGVSNFFGLYNSFNNSITGDWTLSSSYNSLALYESSNNKIIGNWKLTTEGTNAGSVGGLYRSSNNTVIGNWSLFARKPYPVIANAVGLDWYSNNNVIEGDWWLSAGIWDSNFSGNGKAYGVQGSSNGNIIRNGTWTLISDSPSAYSALMIKGESGEITSFELENLTILLVPGPNHNNGSGIIYCVSNSDEARYIIRNCNFPRVEFYSLLSDGGYTLFVVTETLRKVNLGTSTNINLIMTNNRFGDSMLTPLNITPVATPNKIEMSNNPFLELYEQRVNNIIE